MELLAVGAQLIVPIEHQDVLDDNAVGFAVILESADFLSPGRRPVHDLQVLILTVDQLAPAGLVQTEDQIAVFVLVGGLDGGGVAGIDFVGVQADGEAGFLGFLDQPGHTLGGVGVGIDPDGIAGVILLLLSLGLGGLFGLRGLLSAGDDGQHHDESQHKCKNFLHVSSPFFPLWAFALTAIILIRKENIKGARFTFWTFPGFSWRSPPCRAGRPWRR